jgi:hypothetical protein
MLISLKRYSTPGLASSLPPTSSSMKSSLANATWDSFPFKYKPATSFSDNSDVDYSGDDETSDDLIKKLQVKYQIT